MENNRKITSFFLVLLSLLGAVSIFASIATQSWLPVVVFAAILIGMTAVSLIWTAVFVPLFLIIIRACGRHGKERKNEFKPRLEPFGRTHNQEENGLSK